MGFLTLGLTITCIKLAGIQLYYSRQPKEDGTRISKLTQLQRGAEREEALFRLLAGHVRSKRKKGVWKPVFYYLTANRV